MKKIIISLLLITVNHLCYAQGCVAIRSINGFGQYLHGTNAFSSDNWQININQRYFKAFRDFKGTTDQKTPSQNESVTKSYTMEILLTRIFNKGWSVALSLPYLVNSRETNGEHGGPNTTKHTTHSSGIGDIRITAYKWLITPRVNQNFNIEAGLGIKLPTGDYKYQDNFYRNDTTYVSAPVNPAIQLGDGGSGIVAELNTFYFLTKSISLYGNFYYLSNPREQNGSSTLFGRTATSLQLKTYNTVASVTDQYAIRIGANAVAGDWVFSGGLREEGIPVKDLIGGSNGTRRAGYNISVEPGITYRTKKVDIYAYVPVVIKRKIKQNIPDQLATQITGTYTHSPGGSGNYLLFAGIAFRL
ncbi:MAG: hypothetical protein HYR66_11055 [Sphingobacteriales bacterium]|nr:hypothetical protein [Sphingobacteriales bacterium]MBI3718977.1 hypothetical protein [Sphingobacteriales bacterium]